MMDAGRLTVNDLGKMWQNRQWALRHVSFTVPKGQFVVVLGPSGAGKSTLMYCLNRLTPPSEGSVSLGEVNLTALPHRQAVRARRKIGYIFQQFNLIQTYTVRQNVLASRIGHNPWWRNASQCYTREDHQVVERCVEEVGLLDKIDQRADRLSGGQQQRVAIARAMAQEPDIILADEPMASLDPKLARIVLDLLARHSREQGITVIVNLHVLELARNYGQRIIGLTDGQLMFDGTADELTRETVAAIYKDAPDEERPY